jgi:hypothetical protein
MPDSIKPAPGWQQNFNTILLSLCVMGIAWTLKSINDLDSRMAAQEVSLTGDHEAIRAINNAMNDQSKAIQGLNDRLIKLEISFTTKK